MAIGERIRFIRNLHGATQKWLGLKLGFTEKAISVISSEMGFLDCSHFSAFFKKATGMTPKEYRNLCK